MGARIFSFMTLNMWNVNEPFYVRMQRIGDFIVDRLPDVVCLQEVPVIDGHPALPPAFEEAGYHQTYLASGFYTDREEGVAICSRLPATVVGGIMLPSHAADRGRSALAVLICDGKDLRILAVTTHLSYRIDQPDVRASQAECIAESISELWSRFGEVPTVVAGDFNCPEDEAAITVIRHPRDDRHLRDVQAEIGESQRHTLDRKNPFTSSHPRGDRRIDYLLVSQEWKLERFQLVFDGSSFPVVSDHYGLYAEVELPT